MTARGVADRTGAGFPTTPDPDAAICVRSLTMAASQSYDGGKERP